VRCASKAFHCVCVFGKFLAPATSDNVATAKYFGVWMELNFYVVMELFSVCRVGTDNRKSRYGACFLAVMELRRN
jgi:hypothetical protein